MPFSERIRRLVSERAIKEEQEKSQLIKTIEVGLNKLDGKVLGEANPFLAVLEQAGLYGMFKDIRSVLKLEWSRWGPSYDTLRTIFSFLNPDLRYDITPAILNTQIMLISGESRRPEKCVLDEWGKLIERGYDPRKNYRGEKWPLTSRAKYELEDILNTLENKLSHLKVEECSLILKWDYEHAASWIGDTYDPMHSYETWSERGATVTRDKATQEFLLTIYRGRCRDYSITLLPNEWRDKNLVEDVIVRDFS